MSEQCWEKIEAAVYQWDFGGATPARAAFDSLLSEHRAEVEALEGKLAELRKMHSQLSAVCQQHQRDRDAARADVERLHQLGEMYHAGKLEAERQRDAALQKARMTQGQWLMEEHRRIHDLLDKAGVPTHTEDGVQLGTVAERIENIDLHRRTREEEQFRKHLAENVRDAALEEAAQAVAAAFERDLDVSAQDAIRALKSSPAERYIPESEVRTVLTGIYDASKSIRDNVEDSRSARYAEHSGRMGAAFAAARGLCVALDTAPHRHRWESDRNERVRCVDCGEPRDTYETVSVPIGKHCVSCQNGTRENPPGICRCSCHPLVTMPLRES